MREQMLHIAGRLEKRAEAIFNNLWRHYDIASGKPMPKSAMAGALNIMAEEIRETLEPIEYHTYGKGGDVFTIKEFAHHCEVGPLFVDSDGEGYYAKEVDGHISESNRIASPARIAGGDVNKDFTHVCWYNK